ncbi:alpha/beta fold hydrolase [Virgibacillus dakarensis]|uniref:alpha/beta fold hydrolase n=1 Tax=Virgibacillus dakarensis TaxID=1917889 RepID=UPI000B444E25|nr:alpha/beta hydrolase [Virgibacillus dakarensis]
MNKVISKDGTSIAYDKTGNGPVLILVDGALCYRASGPNGPLAEQLKEDFTVYTYDRRGRGDSDEKKPYAVEREVEDIDALIQEAGGSAYVFGSSSGAALALEAARCLPAIKKLALYEAPFVVDDSRAGVPEDYLDQLTEHVASDRRGKAIKLFMGKGVGVPAIFITMMPFMPAWKKMKAIAHTLPYDTILTVDHQKGKSLSGEEWSSITIPTLVGVGGKSPAWMNNAMQELANVLPNTKHRTLEGQTHIVKPDALAPVLTEFFME